ncbi:hypothetical protein ACFLT9_01910 [Acidobacteriota bacterium]
MKFKVLLSILAFVLIGSLCTASTQEETTIIAPSSEVGDNLDLMAVSDLFKESATLEDFEKALNDQNRGINNLDLDEDGNVDFIRVLEEVSDDTHMIILQVPLGEDEYQDVAAIEIEKSGNEAYNVQVHGNEVIYGANYYVIPQYTRIYSWPIFTWMYRPGYRPYRSVYYYRNYPTWWRPWKPVTIKVYRTRTVRVVNRTNFKVTRVSHVRTVSKVNYKHRTSTRVVKSTKIKTRKATVKKTTKKPTTKTKKKKKK